MGTIAELFTYPEDKKNNNKKKINKSEMPLRNTEIAKPATY